MVLARNTISGQIADLSPKILQHPKFQDVLEVVEADAKPYVAELYKPKTKAAKKSARVAVEAEAETPAEEEAEAEALVADEKQIETEDEN